MIRPSRTLKRLIAPVLLAATLIVVQVVLAAPPAPTFTITGPSGNTCGLYTFTAAPNDPDDDVTSIDWDIAGTTAQGPTASATFGTAGARTINLSVTDGSAGDGDLGAETVPAAPQTVNVVNEGPPNATSISATPNPAQPNQAVTFTAPGSSDSGNGSIAKFEWDLNGDGTYETDTGTTNQATQAAGYATNGVHSVGLRVTDNCGAQDTSSGSVFINNSSPTASFTATPNPAAIGAAVSFDGSASADPGGSIANYAWDFGDGTSSPTNTTATATHAYASAGTYFAVLTVTDNDGASTTTFRQLRVNAKPIAGFSYSPLTPLIGETVTFDGSTSRDPDGTALTYEWDLDGNGTYEATGAKPTHVYGSAETVNVKLRVTDSDNTVSDVLERAVTIQATRPNAGFTYTPHDPLPGQAVTLTSTSTPSASPGAPALVATQWDFSYSPLVDFTLDGAGGSIVTSFPTAGPHTVAVKVTESGGGFAIATDTIVVNAPPVASFTVSPAKPVEGQSVTFASTSTDPDGPLAKQEWDLNNDNTYERSGAVVSMSSLKKGARTIRLRVTDSKGATSVDAVPINVAAAPLKPPVRIRRSIGFARYAWGIKLVGLLIKVPRQTTVTVRCSGSGCPSGTFKKRTRKKAGTLVFDRLKGSLRAGAKITVLTTHTGHISRFDTYIVRGKNRGPLLREQCRYRGKKKPQACP